MIQKTQTPAERIQALSRAKFGNPNLPIEIGIPMRDGIELAADVYLPDKTARPAPTIVTITPYDKSVSVQFEHEGQFYQQHGYAYAVVDCRGRGKSEGIWRAFVNDGPDGHDAIEWIAAQPWSNGKVGTTGLSYMGWTQWAAAAELPEHLVCMISTSAAGRWQREIPYTDGCFQLYFAWWAYAVRRRIIEHYGMTQVDWTDVLSRLPLEAIGSFIDPTGETWRDMMDHDTLDEHWQSIRFDDRYQLMNTPCLHVTGWYDLEDLLGAFHHYEGMVASSPARAHQHLIAGPWSHGGSRNPHSSYGGVELGDEAALAMDDVHLRWFDYWLKGIDNGTAEDEPVRLFETGTNRWRLGRDWPRSKQHLSLWLDCDGTDGTLSPHAPRRMGHSRSYRYDPADPAPTQMDVNSYQDEDIPLEQTPVEAREDVITYTSEVLADEIIVSGWPHLELIAASDCDDTEFHVKLTDVWPDGRSLKVCQGCRRASYRDSLTDPTPLVPEERYRFDVELWPVHHAFLPGHRIRVSITSSDFPWFARNLNRFGPLKFQTEPRVATNTIYHGEQTPSRIVLPVERGEFAPHRT